MNKELNELMADVMGWHKERIAPHTSNPLFWHDEQGNSMMYCYAWHPDTDLNQAVMCAENSKVNISVSCSQSKDGDAKWELMRNGSPFPCEYNKIGMMLRQWYSREKLPKAICEAIKEAKGDK